MYKYKKLNARTLSLLSAPALCMSSIIVAHAATLIPNAVYDMTVDSGCFTFGVDCSAGVQNIPAGGVIQIATTDDGAGGVNFTVNSYGMASYTGTAGGFFATFAPGAYANGTEVTAAGLFAPGGVSSGGDTSAMSGSIDAAGVVNFVPTGREGEAEFFQEGTFNPIGIQPWNIDQAVRIPTSTGLIEPFTSGVATSFTPNDLPSNFPGEVEFTATGSNLTDNGDGTFGTTIASAGNVADTWTGFGGTPYSEVYRLTVSVVSADPFAVDDAISTQFGATKVIDIAAEVTGNDLHALNEVLTVTSITQPAGPGASVTIDGGLTTITYIPGTTPAGVNVDSFTYTITDAGGQTDTATVNVSIINGVPPVAKDDAVSTNQNTTLVFDPVAGSTATVGVVDDTDADPGQAATLVISAVDATSANGGTATFAGNDVTYMPAIDFVGVDTFDYTIQDVEGATDTGTVTVTVNAVNAAPVCSDINLTTPIDEGFDINIADDLLSTTSIPALCTDAEGDTVSLDSIDTNGSGGGVIINNNDGTLTYAPASGFEGDDLFSFTATDGQDTGAAQTLTISVADPTLGNFTMLNSSGNTFGGTNDVLFEWDGTSFNVDDKDTTTNATMRSVEPPDGHKFLGAPWFAHHIRIFGPGTYTFDTTCNKADFDAGITDCNRPFTNPGQVQQYLTVTVGPDQIGGLVFFDYTTTEDIDVFLVWNQNAPWDRLGATGEKNKLFAGPAGIAPDPDGDWDLVSTDGDGDGIVGVAMIDGAFIGFSANFNIGPGGTPPPPLEPITGEALDTTLGKSSLNVWSLAIGLFTIFGLRRFRNRG